MTDGISKLGAGLPAYLSGTRSGATQAAPAADPAPVTEQTELGVDIRKALADPGFDAGKVASIRQALTEGNYPLDIRKIAESFAAMERLIGPLGSSGE